MILKANNMYKSFGPTKALNNITFEIGYGEIHGLIGENGSGKSTISSIIAGAQKTDKGIMYFEGKEYIPQDILDANNHAINMIVQEQGTVNDITVAANIFAGKENLFSKRKILSVKNMNQAAQEILNTIGVSHINPRSLVNGLSFEDRKLLEVARAMFNKPKLLIIDETTTALGKEGRDIIYKIIQDMKEQGNSVIFISHDIEELISVCDVVTILRDGISTGKLYKEEMKPNKMKQLMIGREIAENFYRTDYTATSDEKIAIKVDNVAYGILEDISLELKKGEILGIGGLTECGMHDLGKIMFGIKKPEKGTVINDDGIVIDSPSKAIELGIGYVSKDRDEEALMTAGSIKDNICLPSLDKLTKLGWITRKREEALVNKWKDRLSIKMNSINQYCMYLSGGNKQKVSIAKWLARESDIFIFDCPTRGIDIGVKSDIYDLMMELKDAGKAILMISEELPELIGMSDRIIILKDGKIVKRLDRSKDIKESTVIDYMI